MTMLFHSFRMDITKIKQYFCVFLYELLIEYPVEKKKNMSLFFTA